MRTAAEAADGAGPRKRASGGRSEPSEIAAALDLSTSTNLRPLVDQLLKGIATAVKADRATLARIEADSEVVIEGSFDISGQAAEPGRRWTITAPELERLLADRQPLVDAFPPDTLPSPFREQLTEVRHMVLVPLVDGGKVFATITVSRRQDPPFTSEDVTTLKDLGSVAMLALRNTLRLARVESITADLRASEERFRLLVDGVKDYAIFMLDPAGFVTSWNQGARRIKGYRAGEIVGRHFSAFYVPEDVASGKPARALAAAEQQGRYEEEGWRLRKDGSRFLASVVITALRGEGGQLRGFAKVTRDVTEKKRIQDQLLEAERREAAKFRELADQIEALERTKSQFLNLASHELRTPVSLIGGYLSMFAEGDLGDLNPQGKRAIGVLRTQALRLNILIGQMLQAAGIQAGRLALRHDCLDLCAAVAGAAHWARVMAGSDHVVALSLPAGPVWVIADAEHLSTILHNLLDNAVKYSPNGGEIDCTVLAESGWAHVKVLDRGLGIGPEQHGQLFNRFGRVVSDDTAAISGAGLGLYLARQLAQLHGGDVGVESDPGRGSTFVLSLPRADDSAASAAAVAPPLAEES